MPADFSLAGTPLDQWIGAHLDDNVTQAARQALLVPDHQFLVGVFGETDDKEARTFVRGQKPLLEQWFLTESKPGRLRLATAKHVDPQTRLPARALYVVYQPTYEYKPRKPREVAPQAA